MSKAAKFLSLSLIESLNYFLTLSNQFNSILFLVV
jgi:hypothetical protein